MKFEPKRIVVGVDFSDCSAEALRLASGIAEKFSCAVTVLHAIAPDTPASVENDLIEFVRRVIGRTRLPDYRILEMHPSDAILSVAAYDKADLIAVGTRGRAGLNRLTLGSIAEQVLRQATVPVVTVCAHRLRRRGTPLRRILCPVNYSSAAGRAYELAVSFAERLEAELIVLHLIERESSAADLEAEEERLRVWTGDMLPPSARTRALARNGNAADEILRYAAETEVDLIVVAGRRERFSDQTVFGSTTERVTRHAPCAVLTVVEVPAP